ncbi:MAG: class I SAM-dependent methyltransferase [Sphingomonadaceae bacterium]|jgi:SAM-dependent methyltransferase
MNTVESSYYENAQFWTGELFEEEDRQRYDFVIQHIGPEVTSVLDVGCGNGLFLDRVKMLRPDIKTLHGVDRSSAALSHVSVPHSHASADSLPLPAGSFDCVTCLEVIEHLPAIVYNNALSELVRVSNQQILISVPHEQNLTVGRVDCPACRTLFNPDYHLRSFSKEVLSELFEQFNCRLTEVHAFGISREYAFVRQIDSLKRVRKNRFPVDILCPACGEVLAAREGGLETSSKRAIRHRGTLKESVKAIWPKVNHPRWLLANYAKI